MSQKFNVLIVDDSRASRMLSSALIKQLRPQATIFEAADGDSALAVIDDQPADIGILDMNMPGMSGLDLAKEIQARSPDTRLALLTANVQDAIRARAEALGVKFFRKPVTEATLTEILKTLAPEA